MALLRNLVALAAIVIIPFALYLGWQKHLAAAWGLLLVYGATLAFLQWRSRNS